MCARILNKITPDNFDKLSYELTQLPVVNTKEALKGVILLVSKLTPSTHPHISHTLTGL